MTRRLYRNPGQNLGDLPDSSTPSLPSKLAPSTELVIYRTAMLGSPGKSRHDKDNRICFGRAGVGNSDQRGRCGKRGAYQYQLTEDETGTVYDLVGSSDQLGLLVGSDILVTGSRLEQNEDRIASSRDGRVASEGRANETSESDSRDQNSFRVTGAVKFNDLCVLSTTSTTYQRPDLEIEVQQERAAVLRVP